VEDAVEVYEESRAVKEERSPLSNLHRQAPRSPARGAAARHQPGGHISEGELRVGGGIHAGQYTFHSCSNQNCVRLCSPYK
jgi:hypothetical protein